MILLMNIDSSVGSKVGFKIVRNLKCKDYKDGNFESDFKNLRRK
jgi:hypothetical protein